MLQPAQDSRHDTAADVQEGTKGHTLHILLWSFVPWKLLRPWDEDRRKVVQLGEVDIDIYIYIHAQRSLLYSGYAEHVTQGGMRLHHHRDDNQTCKRLTETDRRSLFGTAWL